MKIFSLLPATKLQYWLIHLFKFSLSLGMLVSINTSYAVALPEGCGYSKTAEYPKGTYAYEEGVTDLVKVNHDNDTVNIYSSENIIMDACRYVEKGFDIQLFGKKLGLRSGQRTWLRDYLKEQAVKATADDYNAWRNMPIWLLYPASKYLGLSEETDLSGTCDIEKTFVVKNASLLESRCKKDNGEYRYAFMPHYQGCDVKGGFENLNSQLICRLSWRAHLEYHTGYGSYTQTGINRFSCELEGGHYTYIRTSDSPRQLPDGFYILNSGFYMCAQKGYQLPEGLTLPEGHQIVGYDVLLDLLITKQTRKEGTIKKQYYQALYKPQLCSDMGMTLHSYNGVLYCLP